jgi:CheY-like chemotaxis protein
MAADIPGESGNARADGLASGRRILVVDDHRDSADSLAIALRTPGYRVRTAYDGPGAWAAAEA